MAKITAPVKGFTGTVVGVTFADGQGDTKDEAKISYFRRHGYKVAERAASGPTDAEKKAASDKAAADKKAEADKAAAEADKK
ncbi:hypothetical protein FB562_2201 [Homoserinimonas aerilata]|uniref:Uncharacterized protein n=1 Tax=Homoserinimonas aerilata TaxID=1162970 RepID=A0A542YF22_9MICO|nr:hypothetical protein [Homoserinimonas aerilata]TQL46677.1 hypothetical protein FB562_2201 [Homoserinimonas aerilata]